MNQPTNSMQSHESLSDTLLISVSTKFHKDADFEEVTSPVFLDCAAVALIFSEFRLVTGTRLSKEGMASFYSEEGYYPFTRLLVLPPCAIYGSEQNIDKLLNSLTDSVAFCQKPLAFVAVANFAPA